MGGSVQVSRTLIGMNPNSISCDVSFTIIVHDTTTTKTVDSYSWPNKCSTFESARQDASTPLEAHSCDCQL